MDVFINFHCPEGAHFVPCNNSSTGGFELVKELKDFIGSCTDVLFVAPLNVANRLLKTFSQHNLRKHSSLGLILGGKNHFPTLFKPVLKLQLESISSK